MRIGFIGLGRMGANMVRRLLRDEHEIVAYNRTPEKTKEIAGEGAEAAFTIAELVEKLQKPRAVWIMVPHGDPTRQTVEELKGLLSEGDLVIDGGNSYYKDDAVNADRSRRRASTSSMRHLRRDLGPGVGFGRWSAATRRTSTACQPIFDALTTEG